MRQVSFCVSIATAAVMIVASLVVAGTAFAQARPSTPAMTCQATHGLVTANGAVVLGTGTYTYDRYVSHVGFCLHGQTTRPAWVPTADRPQCFVGYTCIENDFRRGSN